MKVLVLLLSYHLMALSTRSKPTKDAEQQDVWTAECGDKALVLQNASVILPSPILQPRPLNDSLVFILLMSRTAVRICDELNNAVMIELNWTQSEISDLGSSPIEDLISGKYPPRLGKAKQMIRNEINRLSRVGVFLELARHDTTEYKAKLTELEHKIIEILCEMYQVMRVFKMEIKSEVSRDIVTSDHKDQDDISRHSRNFFITRATRNIFQNLVERLVVMTKLNVKKFG